MHSTLKQWLNDLDSEIEIVASNEINEEAKANMVTFGFNAELLQEWGQNSVLNFLISCSDLYKRKVEGLDMVFYSWLDEQAGQFRISAISQIHNKLPFDCKLNLTDLNIVVNGIYSDDSGLYTRGILDVWCQKI